LIYSYEDRQLLITLSNQLAITLDNERLYGEAKRAAESLQDSEEKYRTLFESNIDGIAFADIQGNFLDVNQAYGDMLGYTIPELKKMTYQQVTPDKWHKVEADIHKYQTIARGYTDEYQKEYIKKDGTVFPISVKTWLITDNQGKPIGQWAIVRDITESKLAEGALRESEGKYRKLTESLNELIYQADPVTFTPTYVNNAVVRIYGYTVEEWLGDSTLWEKTIYPDDTESVLTRLEEAKRKMIPFIGEYRILKKDKTIAWVLDHMSWEKDEQGKIIAMDGVVYDITGSKQAEERERKLQRELIQTGRLASVGEMAAGIAHEINNPLTGVVGFSDLLMKKDIPSDIRKDVEMIYQGAQRVAGITRRMLAYSRHSKPMQTMVDINDIIETTLEMQSYEMESSNIKVATRLDPGFPGIIADSGQLQQVFLNIVLNAEIEMTKAHRGGNLTVKTERIDDTIRISFEDDGPGISKENMEKIFDPFFTTREVGQGAGLGLSVCHGIMKQHKGRIYAESTPGKGATFFVELPITTKAEQLKMAEPTDKEPERVSKSRILVVDDDPMVQQFLSSILGEEGHEAEIVDSGDDALKRLRSKDYDVILLDIKLPGMSGIDLYKQLQKKSKSLTRKVLFITGDTLSKDTTAFLSSTRAPHITKPFRIEQLKKEIGQILSQRK
ncbi:PAS domain S-box protein, partial [Chloroflexota bacterium]